MLNLREIHKPTTLADALKFLREPGTVAFAGGTALIAGKRRDVQAVVDLSALGLSYIKQADGAIAIGATTTLTALGESPIFGALANGVICEAAKGSESSVLRNQVTIGGTLISEPKGMLAVALLALDARVQIVGKETRTVPLENFLREIQSLTEQALVTAIVVPMTNPRAAMHSVARTPRDEPIVFVVAAAMVQDHIAQNVRIALGGVAEITVRASAAEQALEGQVLDDALIESAAKLAAQGLSPRGDYRGSAEYRREMAVVLTRRAVRSLRG